MTRTATGLAALIILIGAGAYAQYPQYPPGSGYPGAGFQQPPGLMYPPGANAPGGWPGQGGGFPGQPQFGRVPVYQLRNVQSGEFLYTADAHEADTLARAGTHEPQGTPFSVLPGRAPGTRPLVRYVRGNGTHFLATSPQPARPEITLGFVYTRPRPDTLPLLTWHSPELSHDFYTTDPQNGQPAAQGFRRADVLGYVVQ